jgi:hypothetical protein
VPIPFRDAEDVEEFGAAAFLKIEPAASGTGYVGGLFLTTARGEPLEFVYNRVETPDAGFLWRPADLRRHAERTLTASLLTTCARTPRLLLSLADEVGSELFCQDLQISIPVARIARPLEVASYAATEQEEVVAEPEPLHLFWFPRAPGEGSVERQLVDRLSARGLLLEPFERAALGLREVYPGELRDETRSHA